MSVAVSLTLPAIATNGNNSAATGDDAVADSALNGDGAGAANNCVVGASPDQHVAGSADYAVAHACQNRGWTGTADNGFGPFEAIFMLVAYID